MAITTPNSNHGVNTGSSNSISLAFAGVQAGDQVYAFAEIRNTQGVTSLLFNGQTMTQHGSTVPGSFVDGEEFKYTVQPGDPASGLIVLTITGAARHALAFVVKRGADTPGTLVAATPTVGGTSISQNVASQTGSEVIAWAWVEAVVTALQGGGQTTIQNENEGTDTFVSSYEAGAGTVTMSFSWTGNEDAFQAAHNLTALAVAANPRRAFLKTVKATIGRVFKRLTGKVSRVKLLRGRILAGNQTIAPAAVPITVVLPTPALAAGAVSLASAAVSISLTCPTVTLAAVTTVSPAAVPISVTLPTPQLNPGAAAIAPAAAVISLVVPTPTISASTPFLRRNRVLVRSTAVRQAARLRRRPASGIRFFAGSVEAGVNQVLTPASANISVTVPSPNIGAGAVSLATPVAVVTLTAPTPALLTAGTMAPAAVQINVIAPTASLAAGGVTLSPPSANISVTGPTPSLSPGVRILAIAPAVITVTGPTPSLLSGTLLSPAAVAIAVLLPTPTLLVGAPPVPEDDVLLPGKYRRQHDRAYDKLIKYGL